MSLNFQATCYWCTTPIYTLRVWDIDTFWNHDWEGYPICAWCREGLLTDGKESMDVLRVELGLSPIGKVKKVKLRGLDQWI